MTNPRWSLDVQPNYDCECVTVMFYKAALDILDREGKPDLRFYSCVRFVADSCSPAVFYVNDIWSKHEEQNAYVEGFESALDGLPSQLVERVKEQAFLPMKSAEVIDSPVLVYLKAGSWDQPPDPDAGRRDGLVVPKREFVLSSSEVVHKAHMYDYGLNAQTAILCLAAVGLDFMLPNISFDIFADEEIESLKDAYATERHQYLEVAAALANQSYEGLRTGDYHDVLRWAESEVAFKLAPKARLIEEVNRSGFSGGSKSRKDWSHGKRQQSEPLFT